MPYEGALQGIGSLAGSFAEGYRQARAQRVQEMHQNNAELDTHIDQIARQMNDAPTQEAHDALAAAYTHLMSKRWDEKPTAAKKGGIGETISRLFGFGQNKAKGQTPADTISSTPEGPNLPKPPDPTGPDPVSPGSGTYGSLGTMLGNAVDTAPPPPTYEKADGSPSSMPPAAAAPVALPSPPASPSLSIPTAADLLEFAHKQSPAMYHPSQQQYELVQNQEHIAASKSAQAIAERLLGDISDHLKGHPEIKKFSDAVRNPEFGADLAHDLDVIGGYETGVAGHPPLIPPGTMERWKVNHGFEPETPVQAPHYQTDAEKVFAARVAAANGNNTVESDNLINADNAARQDQERITKAPDTNEAIQSAWSKSWDMAHPGGATDAKARAYQERFHPVQPPSQIVLPGGTAQNGARVLTMINPKDGTVKTTNVTLPVDFDLDSVMYTAKDVPTATGGFKGGPGTIAEMRVFDPEQVKNAYRLGKLGGAESLQSIVNSGHFKDDADRKNLELYLKSILNPDPYAPAK